MIMDNDIKKLTSEEKNGKYDILTNILKICGIIFICLIQFLIIYFSFKYIIVKLSLICIQILALIHLNIFSRIKEYKIVWCTLIILFPGISSIIYFLAGNNSLNKKEIILQNRFEKVYNDDIKNTEILKSVLDSEFELFLLGNHLLVDLYLSFLINLSYIQ